MSVKLTWPANEQRMLDAALNASVRDTRWSGDKSLGKAMWHMLRSGRAALQTANLNRKIQKGARGGQYYEILRQGKEPYRKYLNPSRRTLAERGGNTRESRAAFRKQWREQVKNKYRRIPRRGFARGTFTAGMGKVGSQSGKMVGGASKYVRVKEYMSESVVGKVFLNTAAYIKRRHPNIESLMVRRGTLSFLATFNKDLASKLKRRFPDATVTQ